MPFEESMLLWLPSYLVEENDTETIANVTKANGAILDFLDGELTLAQMLEIVDDLDTDVDDYLKSLDSNLRQFGA